MNHLIGFRVTHEALVEYLKYLIKAREEVAAMPETTTEEKRVKQEAWMAALKEAQVNWVHHFGPFVMVLYEGQ